MAYDMRISDWSSDVCSSDLKDIVNLAKRTLGFDLSPKSGPAAASIAFESRNARMLVLDHAGNCSEGPVGDVPGDCAAKLTRCQTPWSAVGSGRNDGCLRGSEVVIEVIAEPVELPDYRSEEHTSELQSLMRISYAVFCLKKKNKKRLDKNT